LVLKVGFIADDSFQFVFRQEQSGVLLDGVHVQMLRAVDRPQLFVMFDFLAHVGKKGFPALVHRFESLLLGAFRQRVVAGLEHRGRGAECLAIEKGEVGTDVLVEHLRLDEFAKLVEVFEDLLEFQGGIRDAGKAQKAHHVLELEAGGPGGRGGCAPSLGVKPAPLGGLGPNFRALQVLKPPAQNGNVLNPGGLPTVARLHGCRQSPVHLFEISRAFAERLHAAPYDLGKRARFQQIAIRDFLAVLAARPGGVQAVGATGAGLRRAGFSFDQAHDFFSFRMGTGGCAAHAVGLACGPSAGEWEKDGEGRAV
jgi:hypothetical protein